VIPPSVEKRAFVPTPSADPLVEPLAPPPARTVTTPEGEVRRTVFVFRSLKKTSFAAVENKYHVLPLAICVFTPPGFVML
jgi:hypothetical protein